MNPVLARAPVERIKRIAAALNDGPVSQDDLAAALEVSRKTVQRDVDFMRDRLGLPIATDKSGTYFTKRVTLCACCGKGIEG